MVEKAFQLFQALCLFPNLSIGQMVPTSLLQLISAYEKAILQAERLFRKKTQNIDFFRVRENVVSLR